MTNQAQQRPIMNAGQSWVGQHCETAALKRVLDSCKTPFSEEMLLGLGGGIGFIYWYMKGMLGPVVGGRYGSKRTNFIQQICQRIGAETNLSETGSAKAAYNNLTVPLQNGQPVIAYVDMAFLPYLVVPKSAHFGGHTITVFHVDDDNAHIYDRGKTPVTATLDELAAARNSKFKPFPPKNRTITVAPSAKPLKLESGIRDAITDCCNHMLNPPIKNIGLEGLLKWAALVPKWPEMFKGMSLYACLLSTFIYIRVGGSGGSAFRSMYAAFLKEASAILAKPALEDVGKLFRQSADVWRQIAEAALPDDSPTLKKIKQLMLEKNERFEKGGPEARQTMEALQAELDGLQKHIEPDLKNAPRIAACMRERILECYEIEKHAIGQLQRHIL